MILTLLKRLPGTLFNRLGYELRRFFPRRPMPATSAESQAEAVDESPSLAASGQHVPVPATNTESKAQADDESASLATYIQHVPVADQATLVEMHRSQESFYDHANPINRCAAKVFSQNGEDGIIFEIVRRLGLTGGVFAEFGVGVGLENNTLALAAAGWRGFWVGGEDIVFDVNPERTYEPSFVFDKQWVTLENVAAIYKKNLSRIQESHSNLISMDLDGNDIYFVKELLEQGASPEIFIVEYNGKFRPPIEFTVDYDADRIWDGNDYFGASLASFYKLFDRCGYFLVCCDLTGLNAFFVRNDLREMFPDIPLELHQIYESPKYFFTGLYTAGHATSPSTIQTIFSKLNRADRKSPQLQSSAGLI